MEQDPWTWTVDQVLDFFRNDAAAIMADRPNSRLPDLPYFLEALRENEVAGPALLDAVDGSFLKEDCGIKILGVRSTVIHCISKLKARSKFITGRGGRPTPEMHPNTAVTLQPHSSAQAQLVHEDRESPARIRNSEVEIEDSHGRKRRKLNLMAAQQEYYFAGTPPPPTQEPIPLALPTRTSPRTGAFLGDSGLPVDELFYGKARIGQVIDLCPEKELLESVGFDHEGTEYENEYEYWQIDSTAHEKPAGEVSYVDKQLRHFFQNGERRKIKRGGSDAIALLPYREEFATEKRAVSATVFRMQTVEEAALAAGYDVENQKETNGGLDAIAIRENAAYLDGDVDYTKMSGEATTGEWDFLLGKHREDDQLLPEYGESEQSISSSLEREMAAENDEEEVKRRNLSHEAAADKIEQRIRDFAERWEKKKLPILTERREWSIWKQTKQSRTRRENLIKGAKATISRLDQRLQKQKTELLRDQWPLDGKDLEEVCEIMSATVEDREEQKWKIQVWQRKKEPDHVVRRGQTSTSKSKPSAMQYHSNFVVHPDDRISLSPAPQNDIDEQEDVYREPHGSQAGDEDTHGRDGATGDDEMSVEGAGDKPTLDFIDDGNDAVGTEVLCRDATSASHPPDEAWMVETPTRKAPQLESDIDSPILPDASSFVKASQQVKAEKAIQTPMKKTEVIEISSDSPPHSTRGKKTRSFAARPINYNENPVLSVASEVKRWEMEELVTRKDRLRLVIKLLAEAGLETRKRMLDCLTRMRRNNFTERLLDALLALKAKNDDIGSDSDTQVITFCAKLHLVHAMTDPELVRSTAALKKVPWHEFVHNKNQASMFVDRLSDVLQRNDSPLFNASKLPLKPRPAPATSQFSTSSDHSTWAINSSESESEAGLVGCGTPSKKRGRKRKPQLGAFAAQSQQHALNRQVRFNALQAQVSNSQELAAIVSTGASHSSIQINLLKEDEQDAVYVDKNIAQALKDHQISGVRFMWRELTAGGEKGPQGCILAHTMGLGKTLQLITLLIALNEATQSKTASIRDQLPKKLRVAGETGRQLRVLVLAPPSLLENWRNEINVWGGEKLSNVFAIESGDARRHLSFMENWHEAGGILLIGYDLFRNKVNERKTKTSEPTEYSEIRRYLLQGPELIVADEAHVLKNENSGVSMAARKIWSQSRVALTGTPMSNDVQEIYSLVSFAAPDYLGGASHFNAHYAKVIKDGNVEGCSNYQKRRGMKKLAVLHRLIEPKVDRANITVLRGSLPSKVEFVVFLPLLDIQRKVYSKYVGALLGDSKNDKASQVAIFGWISVLALLTAHPRAFKRKLLHSSRTKSRLQYREPTPFMSDSGASGVTTPNSEERVEEDEAGAAICTLGFSELTIQEITSGISNDLDCQLSAKMSLLMDIVNLSKRCGDKVLVFSHSLGTLDYLEQLFRESGIDFARIDGSVLASKRLAIIEEFQYTKHNVLIVSTKAGNAGLNIQSANRIVILDFGFNPSFEEQAIGRAYRLGQTKPVFVYRFVVDGTFEMDLYKKQRFKTSLTSRVVDKKNTKSSANGSTRDWLYDPLDVQQSDVTPFMKKDEAVLDCVLKSQLQRAQQDADYTTLVRRLQTIETLTEEVPEVPLNAEEQLEVDQEVREGFIRGQTRKGAVPARAVWGSLPSTAPAIGPNRPAKNDKFAGIGMQAAKVLPTFASQSRTSDDTNSGITGRPTLNVRLAMPNRTGLQIPPPQPASNIDTLRSVPHGLPLPPPPSTTPGPR